MSAVMTREEFIALTGALTQAIRSVHARSTGRWADEGPGPGPGGDNPWHGDFDRVVREAEKAAKRAVAHAAHNEWSEAARSAADARNIELDWRGGFDAPHWGLLDHIVSMATLMWLAATDPDEAIARALAEDARGMEHHVAKFIAPTWRTAWDSIEAKIARRYDDAVWTPPFR